MNKLKYHIRQKKVIQVRNKTCHETSGNNKKLLFFRLQILSSKPNKICKQDPYLSQISHSYKIIICLQNPVHSQISDGIKLTKIAEIIKTDY